MSGGRVEVAAAIIWQENRLLVCQRPPSRAQAGFWEFPGGKLEAAESPEEALVREIREELGLTVRNFHFWRTVDHDYAIKQVRLHFFHVTRFDGDPTPLDGQAFRWVSPRDALALPFLEADRPLLEELARE